MYLLDTFFASTFPVVVVFIRMASSGINFGDLRTILHEVFLLESANVSASESSASESEPLPCVASCPTGGCFLFLCPLN